MRVMFARLSRIVVILATVTSFAAAAARTTDLNGDGRSDLLWRNWGNGQVFRMLMNGFSATASSTVYTEADLNWSIVGEGDFNNDTVVDLLWRHSVSGQVYVQLFTAAGTPSGGAVVHLEPDARWKIVATPDLNGDGRADILWWNSASGQLFAMLMNGASITTQGVVHNEPDTLWQVVGVGDMDGDGKHNQVVYRHMGSGQVYLMTVSTTSGFSTSGQVVHLEPDTNWRVLGAADFDGNGRSDILWRHSLSGQVYVQLMNGNAVASGAVVYTEPNPRWRIVAQGDYDGDNRADILWRHDVTGDVYMVRMNGLAIAAQQMVYVEPSPAWRLMGPAELETVWPFTRWTGIVPSVPPSKTGKTIYVDGTGGSDSSSGLTLALAVKTIGKAVSLLAAGDTILIRKGLYREPIYLLDAPSGTAAKPITIGSYGDGEVIVDGSTKVTGWVNLGGTVWRATLPFVPNGIVVNEVPLKQVRQGQSGSTAPQEGVAGVTNGSGKWHRSGTTAPVQLTADFGTSIGAGDPNQADIVVISDDLRQEHIFWYHQDYITFKGLTVRGSGSNGLWGYGRNVTVESCDVKFNGKAAVAYFSDSSRASWADNAVINSHAYHNNLWNWPRGNNGFAEDGGGWPGTMVWDANLRPLARGNVVHMNGGEGIISYGTSADLQSGSALFEQNIAYDNWSVNMYFDNQPNNIARNNFLFNHPPNPANYLHTSANGVYSNLDKYNSCLMLADESISSDNTNGGANLNNSQVYNNVMAGCRIGIRDYSEGSTTTANHGMKNTLIANNTIIMPFHTFTNTESFGIYIQDNGNRNTGSKIQNNVIYHFNSIATTIHSELNGTLLPGININNNVYFSSSPQPFSAGYNSVVKLNFTQWKSAIAGADTNGKFQEPQLYDITHFRGGTWGVNTLYDFAKAAPQPGSPAVGAGTPQTFTPAVNFTGANRSGWNAGAF